MTSGRFENPNGRGKARLFWLYAVTVALACAHGGQCIVFHNALPGDLADSRLGNCILEHVYQCLRGYGHFLSPAQFYPIKGTLVFSDNHFGTVLFYALFRVLGASMEGAFEGWILLVLSFNTVALLFLLRQLRVHPFIACPLAFFGTSSSALLFKTGHPQVLSFFPFIFCLAFTCKFLRSADTKQLAWAMLWFAYQNWCYLYAGYFTIYICGIIIALYLVLFARREFWHDFLRSLREHWLLVSWAIAFSLVLLIVIYFPYARFSAGAGTRPMAELIWLAPNPGAWFSASPYGIFYSSQQFYKPGANAAENTLFSGWSFWLLAPAIIATALRNRQRWDMKLALVLSTTILLLIFAVTTWSGSGSSIYLMLAQRVPSIRAFRAFARIAYLLIILEAVVIAFFFNYHYRRVRPAWARGWILLFACVVPGENLAFGQISYLKTTTQQRGAALVEMWQKAGEREVLVFAPGYTNQGFQCLNIECWQAALLLHKKTLNGYSGIVPSSHLQFIFSPTEANARALLASLNIPREICSIVTDWPERIKQTFNIRTYHFSGRATPFTATKAIIVAPLQSSSISVSVRSDENEDLDCDMLQIYASYRLYSEKGTPVSDPPSLRTRIHTLRHGENVPFAMLLQAPSKPGTYEARLSMVHEGVAWWADLGSPGSVVKVIVAAPAKSSQTSSLFGYSNTNLPVDAVTPAPNTKYELGTLVRFGSGEDSERFRTSGWSHTEDQMTWTEGNSAVLKFSGLPKSQALTLKIAMAGLTSPELPAQTAEVYANGKKIAEWQVAATKEYVAAIPPDIVSDMGTLTIEFRIPKAISPKSLGLSVDQRVLGVSVFNLVIDRAP